jgi:hypothetical protein
MKNMSNNKGTSKANLKLRGEAPLTMNFGLVAYDGFGPMRVFFKINPF